MTASESSIVGYLKPFRFFNSHNYLQETMDNYPKLVSKINFQSSSSFEFGSSIFLLGSDASFFFLLYVAQTICYLLVKRFEKRERMRKMRKRPKKTVLFAEAFPF